MKNIGTILAAIFLGLVLLLYMCAFQVRFTEVAIKVTWGKPAKAAIDDPGLGFKWPAPVQTVVKYDKRIRTLEDRVEETSTKDRKNILLTTYTLWRIADAATFHTNFPNGVEDAESKLLTTIGTHKLAVIGNRDLREFISTDPEDRKIAEMEQVLRSAIAKDTRAYGVEIVGFGFKKLGLSPSVTTSIFEQMRSNEEKEAAKYIAQGEADASRIIAKATAAEQRILAAARQKVAGIEANAQSVVSGYYAEFKEHPELQIFLDKLRTVANALQTRTTLILDTATPPWDVFDEQARKRIPEGERRVSLPLSPVVEPTGKSGESQE